MAEPPDGATWRPTEGGGKSCLEGARAHEDLAAGFTISNLREAVDLIDDHDDVPAQVCGSCRWLESRTCFHDAHGHEWVLHRADEPACSLWEERRR